jgi:hypothetical protein
MYSSDDDTSSTSSSDYTSSYTETEETDKKQKRSNNKSEEEDDEDDYVDEDEEPSTWKHAMIVEDAVQLENSLKLNLQKKSGGMKRRHIVMDPLGVFGDITQFVNEGPGLNPNVEGFIPSRYLASFHKRSDQKQLANGKINTEHSIKKQQEYMKELVRNNLARFVYCKDNVEEIFMAEDDGAFQGTWLRTIEMNYKGLYLYVDIWI